ncbi:MAG: sugar ABC transporter permease YjfF [Phycisphaerales bacterium]|nr:sugar ABC transporter permease YjfF [Phycisphaerales bacterium]
MTLRRGTLPCLAACAVMILAWTIGALVFRGFGSWIAVRNLLADQAVLGVAATGATFVIIGGGIDLSVGAVMALAAVLAAALVEQAGWHPGLAMPAAVLAGALFGRAQGEIIRRLDVPAFLVTLAGMFLARGLAFAISPRSISTDHPFWTRVVHESLTFRLPLGPRGVTVPPTVGLMVLVIAGAWWTLTRTRFGRCVYAMGDDPHAARLLGAPVARDTARVYMLAGALSALAGVMTLASQQSGDPAAHRGFELDVIAAVVVGGTLLRGGYGSVFGTFCGVMILGIIQMYISFHGTLSSWWSRLATGGLMLVFLVVQRGLEGLGTARKLRPGEPNKGA